MLVPDAILKNIEGVGDKNCQNSHQHLKIVANTFDLQHPSPTSMQPFLKFQPRKSNMSGFW